MVLLTSLVGLSLAAAAPPDSLAKELIDLSAKNDYKQESRFFTVLKRLGKKQGRAPSEFLVYETGIALSGGGGGRFSAGRVVTVESGSHRCLLVVLELEAFSGPGLEAQQLLLMDQDGTLLDKLGCSMSVRYGRLRSIVNTKSGEDKAHVVIDFIPNLSRWHNWHTITYKGQAYTFYDTSSRNEDTNQPSEWTKNGLCRVSIENRRFTIIFPKLTKPDSLKMLKNILWVPG